MPSDESIYATIQSMQELVYDKCGLSLTNLTLNKESVEYGACSFYINRRPVEFRISRITPTKAGQFVTIWKRNNHGITEPFDISDRFEFIIVISKSDNKIGQFIFPKSVLVDKGIISRNGKGGKRGIRVYPPWDIVSNKQAEQTQRWQTEYFVNIENDNIAGISLVERMFCNKN